MPKLCTYCCSEADGPECEYCGELTIDAEIIYELTSQKICSECGSKVIKRRDYDEIGKEQVERYENRDFNYYCNICKTITIHHMDFLKWRLKSYDAYLEKAYKQELKVRL